VMAFFASAEARSIAEVADEIATVRFQW
jgi:hypothetical protein